MGRTRGGKRREARPYRALAAPFVVAPPSGCRVRTRLRLSAMDAEVVRAVGEHLGSLAGADLAERVRIGSVPASQTRRAERKKALTARSSSRWAGAITRTSEDQFQSARRALNDRIGSLRQAVKTITDRLAVPMGTSIRKGRRTVRGYVNNAERQAKQQRLQILTADLREAVRERDRGRVRVTRGGRQLLNSRHHLYDTAPGTKPLTEADWRARLDQWDRQWSARRLFLTADGEAGAPFGNYTISISPHDGKVALVLPEPLRERYANAPRGRYVLDAAAAFSHQGQVWRDRVSASAPVRYDLVYHPDKDRWYVDASWSTTRKGQAVPVPALETLRRQPILAIDLNADHLAAWVLDIHGNPVGPPHTAPLALVGLPATTRDARLREAISQLNFVAQMHGCAALVVENLNFTDARATGRETLGRGRYGKAFRRTVSGIPTAQFRDRLAGMAHHMGLSVIAVDPAYTSRWGAQHWLKPLQQQTFGDRTVSGHHAAAVVVGRRAIGVAARRRNDGTRQTPNTRRAETGAVRPEDRTGSTVPAAQSHRPPARSAERTAPARTQRGTLGVRQTRGSPIGKHPPHGSTTVWEPNITDQLTLFGISELANHGQPS